MRRTLHSIPSSPLPGSGVMPAHPASSLGFTMVELLVVISILGILVALAAPSFRPVMENWRLRSAAEALQSSLYYARSAAIQRGGRVAIAKTGNHGKCTTAASAGQWGCGWQVFVDENGNGRPDSGEEVLHTVSAPTRLQITMGNGNDALQLDRWGRTGSRGIAIALQAVNSHRKTTLCLAISGLVLRDPARC